MADEDDTIEPPAEPPSPERVEGFLEVITWLSENDFPQASSRAGLAFMGYEDESLMAHPEWPNPFPVMKSVEAGIADLADRLTALLTGLVKLGEDAHILGNDWVPLDAVDALIAAAAPLDIDQELGDPQ